MQCRSCKKMIDDDSLFCKYCGVEIIKEHHTGSLDEEKMSNIFLNVKETLYNNSSYTIKEFDEKFDVYKNYENKAMSDNDYYRLLVDIVFYSGFKASTVDKYLDTIHSYFSDYKVAMLYDLDKVEKIKNEPKMIQKKPKINQTITAHRT